MYTHLLDFLNKQDVEYYRNYKLATRSSIGIGGEADIAIFPNNEEIFVSVLQFLCRKKIKFKVVGNLTNLLISDLGFRGAIVFSSNFKSHYVAEKRLYVSAGASLSSVIKKNSRLGYTGLDELYGIPGSVGGMVYNNAGAYGKSVSDALLEAKVFSKSTGEITILKNEDLNFSYRDSLLKKGDCILISAVFSLECGDAENITASLRDIISRRRASQPLEAKSLGSVFKRHSTAPLSLLIDRAGLKGAHIGGAMISTKHAGFVVNNGGATSADVKEVLRQVAQKVFDASGIRLEPEVRIW